MLHASKKHNSVTKLHISHNNSAALGSASLYVRYNRADILTRHFRSVHLSLFKAAVCLPCTCTSNLLLPLFIYRAQLQQDGQPSPTLTEEAALARALQLSLIDVQHQEHAHVPGRGAQAAAAASTALQDAIPPDMQSMAPE